MPLAAGSSIGPYDIVGLIGTGGMGEVYRARDPKLHREIALKILPEPFATDADRLTRFAREARALAALNHPHIAQIYGVEESSGARALVMEVVEGETLAERTARGALPVPETVAIARQIADALDSAHERGIIHRDLKPANIMLRPDGNAKVLDFGLAKAFDHRIDGDAAQSLTATAAGTRVGAILGTTAYMSPEQARGQAVDKRTDIWAFGCVVYEMLTGRAAFAGDTVSDTVARILEREPDWSVLPEATPSAMRRLLRRCLDKDPQRRLRDVADARHYLDDAVNADSEATVVTASSVGAKRWRWALVATTVGVVVTSAAYWIVSTLGRRIPALVLTRTTISLPPTLELDTGAGAFPLAIAPDGRHIAYVSWADGRRQLYVRSFDAFEARPIGGTEGAQYPFFSPDGEWVAFFADRKLKRVSIRGGSPVTICGAPTVHRGGSWAPDGTIVFDPGDSGLLRVSSSGGNPEPLRSRDPEMDRSNLSWPHFLPDGRVLLATVGNPAGVNAELAVLSLETGEWQRLGPGSQAQYLATGHLVYHAVAVREGELHAVALGANDLTLSGGPVAVVDSVFRAQDGGGAYFAVAQNGTLIYAPGGYARTLVRVDRNGRRTPISDDRRGVRHPEISPDGQRVAVTIDPRPSQISVYDIARRTWTLISSAGHNLCPVWTPDGQRITYSSGGDLHWRAADASSDPERLLARERAQYATSWSRDARLLFFDESQLTERDKYDICVLPTGHPPQPLIATEHDEAFARLSPDGRWLAYHSDETGRFEVYVRRFPDVRAGKWTISNAGGRAPRWSSTGRELFYAAGSGTLMRVSIDTQGTPFRAGTPEPLFSGPFDLVTTDYSVSHDGNHFIMVETDPNATPTQLHVTLNWAEELNRLVPPWK